MVVYRLQPPTLFDCDNLESRDKKTSTLHVEILTIQEVNATLFRCFFKNISKFTFIAKPTKIVLQSSSERHVFFLHSASASRKCKNSSSQIERTQSISYIERDFRRVFNRFAWAISSRALGSAIQYARRKFY